MKQIKRFAKRRKVLLLRSLLLLIPMLVAVTLLSQTALAMNTYVITDGSRVFTYTTYATDPAQVLGEIGLKLDANDTYTTETGIISSSITVNRSKRVTVSYYGESTTVSSGCETVGELLTQLNISLSENDVVSAPLTDVLTDGMTITVDLVLELTQSYSGIVPHDTTYCYDSSIPEGREVVLTRGVDGETLRTASVKYVNGKEVARKDLSETLTTAPVTEVIAIGTAKSTTIDPNGMPLIEDGKITLPTGEVLTYTRTLQVGATAYYCEPWERGITYSGTKARVGEIAVDPSIIPLGSRLFIVSNDGEIVYGIAVAEDTGSLIKGYRIDLYYNTYDDCAKFGYRECTVYFLDA